MSRVFSPQSSEKSIRVSFLASRYTAIRSTAESTFPKSLEQRSLYMKLRFVAAAFAVICVAALLTICASAQTNGYRISEPVSYKNLSIFLIHGKDENTKGNILTLQEAMVRNLFAVYETAEVNELQVGNL